ncbi:tetratricopeptide repeat protein [Nitrobacter sp.]|uniref:tetratricopeptide repeat protein n=1 Tax=unclassified Nitrobacter TaxID=2620411 RepID=UPI00321FC9B5
MTFPRPVAIVAGILMLGESAAAQLQPSPAADPSPAGKSVTTKAIKPPTPPTRLEPDNKANAQVADDPNADAVYGAYQRGRYKTAFDLALKRAQEDKNPAAMTMLGELYANGLGVRRDYGKAIEWHQRAADLGDREAMFALAMLRISGRGGPPDRAGAVKWLTASAKLGQPKAAYNLALLHMDGQTLPQDFKRAAELLRFAADAGSPEAQYALATFYKEGTGVEKNLYKSVRLLQAASLAGNVDAEVEYAIALFNGSGTQKNEAAAVSLLRKAARRNSAIAQNRLAHALVEGMGVPMDKVEGLKWHIVAKTGGKGDLQLDAAMARVTPEERANAESAARKWLGIK